MSVSAMRDPGERQRSVLETLLRSGPVNIAAEWNDGLRRLVAKEAHTDDERQRRQYADALNLLKPTELLQEELQFLANAQQQPPRQDPGGGSSNRIIDNDGDDDDFDDAATISTTLTGMQLEDGILQRPRHLKKIVSGFERHNGSPAQPLPDHKRTARGCRGGRRAPQRPDEDLLNSLQDDSHAVDPSDMTSDVGSTRSYGFGAHPGGGNHQDDVAAATPKTPIRHASAPPPVTPNNNNNKTNTNNNALRMRPATPFRGDRIVSPASDTAKRMKNLHRQRAAVLENYKDALRVLTDNDVRIREIDAEMKLLCAGAGVVDEEEEEEEQGQGQERNVWIR